MKNNIEKHKVTPYALIVDKEILIQKKKELESSKPFDPHFLENMNDWFRIELTYTSNAIEGNTLTRQETASIVEKDITVGGKSLVEHLEAKNHALAFDWIIARAKKKSRKFSEKDILKIHEIILAGIDTQNAGRYRSVSVRISGSRVILPNPQKVAKLMGDLSRWLSSEKKLHPIDRALDAHYQLVTIHPFIDGNGRTARLLMNLMLINNGFPPALIRKRDRLKYINSLEKAQLSGDKKDYENVIYEAINRSFDIYLKTLKGEEKGLKKPEKALLKIGEVAKRANLTVPTIRHWTQLGLIKAETLTESGYQLYAEETLTEIKEIQALKDRRYRLSEIAQKRKKK